MELKEIVSLFRQWLWLLIVGLILGLGSGIAASRLQEPVYEASAKALVTRSRQPGSTDLLPMSDQQLVLTYLQLLKTRPVLEEVSSRLGTKVKSGAVTVDVVADTQIIQIKVQNQDAKRAADIANTLVQVLIEQNESLQTGRYTTYEDGLNAQVAQVQDQISALQSQITELNQANVEDQLSLVNQQITDLQGQISTLEAEIAQFPSLLSAVDRASLTENQTRLDQLRSLLYLYQQIQTNLIFIGKPTQGGSSLDNPRLATLQATLDLYQQLYLNLLNGLQTVNLARVQSTPTVSLIEAAVIPEWPIRPIPMLYAGLSAIVGLIIAGAGILLIDYLDDTLKSPRKVQEVLRIPVLGEIVEAAPTNKVRRLRPPSNQLSSSLLNAFGILRISVGRLIASQSLKTILITSPSLGEGKTTIATNLAAAFGRLGKKVVLIDADLYHPSLHSRLGLDNEKGLIDVLANNVDWKELLRDFGGIQLMTSGPQTPASAVLLESNGMMKLLEQLEKEFDLVIIDGPPLFVEDTQILASKVGGVLLVVRLGATITVSARAMLDQLELIGANVLGVALNRVPRAEMYYFNRNADRETIKLEKPLEVVETVQS